MVQTRSPGTFPASRFLRLPQPLHLLAVAAVEAAEDVVPQGRLRRVRLQQELRQEEARQQAVHHPGQPAAVRVVGEAVADAAGVRRLQLKLLQRHRCPSWIFVLRVV
jgi:hypothetical protein